VNVIGVLIKITLEFKSHHYIKEYEKCNYYCRNCGNKNVWEEQGEGDYYEGCDYICTSCDYHFTLPSLNKRDSGWELIPEQLRTGKQLKPISPEGN